MTTNTDTTNNTSTKAIPTTAAAKPISGPGADPGPVKETTTESGRAKSDSQESELSAREQAEETVRKATWRFVRFIAKYVVAMLFVFLTAITGTLLHVDFWPSWFWMIPVVIFVTPIVIDLLINLRNKRKEQFGQVVKRRIQSLVVAVIVLVLLLLIIWSNLHILGWYLIGNETLDSPGIIGWGMSVSALLVGLPLAIIAGVLTIAVPAVLLVRLTKDAARDDVVMWRLLLLALGTAVAFALPLGWSFIMNANM